MKKIYIIPNLQVTRICEAVSLLEGSKSGEISTGDIMSKESGKFEEEENGIPTKFSNIWGDGEDED